MRYVYNFGKFGEETFAYEPSQEDLLEFQRNKIKEHAFAQPLTAEQEKAVDKLIEWLFYEDLIDNAFDGKDYFEPLAQKYFDDCKE